MPSGVTFNGECTRDVREQFQLSSTAHVDLADPGDTVCEEVYTLGVTKNETELFQVISCQLLNGSQCNSW